MSTYFTKILIFLSLIILRSDYELVSIISSDVELIRTNSFGHIYIYAHNSLKKYDKNGKQLNSYSERTNGQLSTIDVSDPYLLLLYYEDLNRIVFLDDRLAPVGSPLDLDVLEVFNISTVCKSKKFAVWLYDRFDNRLINYGFNPKGVLREIRLDPLNLEHDVLFMRESGNYLIANTGKELLVLDSYGSYLKSIESNIEKSFQIWNKHIIAFTNNKLFIQSIEENEKDSINIDFVSDIKLALLEEDRLFIQKSDSIYIYKKLK